MDPAPFSVHLHQDVETSGALVIVGAPGLGLVGSIATRYVVQLLKMPLVGGVYSTRFPPVVQVADGRLLPPVRIYATKARGRFGLDSDRLLVVHTEADVSAEWVGELAVALAEWARGAGCQTLALVDGIYVADEASDDVVLGVAALPQGVKALEQQKVGLLPAGTVGGLAGALLQAGARSGMNVVALLAEAKPGVADARAAARLVQILDRMIPAIHIEVGPLLQQAEGIEAAVRKAQDTMQAESSRRADDATMYH